MILVKNNNEYTLLTVPDEASFMKLNPTHIQVDTLPESHYGFYKFKDGDYIVDVTREFIKKRESILELLDSSFLKLFTGGTFMTSLGFEIDNRRDGIKNDKENVDSLILLGLDPVNFRDSLGNFHTITQDNLKTIRLEMIQDGLGKYQWKWSKEQEVYNANTITELEEIII